MKPIDIYRNKLSEDDARFIEQIEAEADSTPARDKGLAIHVGAIEKLRGKGYTYRDIAAWFSERNIKVTHVDVWRAHKNGVEPREVFDLADHDEEWQEYMRTKREGNVTKYEDVNPEAVEPAATTDKASPKSPEKVTKPATKRARKAAVRK